MNSNSALVPHQSESRLQIATVKATEVRPGDIVKGKVVESVRSGPKWTYLRDGAGKTIREARNETSLEVQRLVVPGVSETASGTPLVDVSIEERRNVANTILEQKVATRKAIFEEMKTKVVEEMEENEFVSPATLGILLTAQADLKIMNEFADLVMMSPAGQDLVGLQKEFAQRLIDRLVSGTQNRAIVRQEASVVSHLVDDCEREAMARYIESAHWFL